MSATQQQDAPPPYARREPGQGLQVPMSDSDRQSMEDESRELPDGWIRQFDPGSAHHFYVDTRAKPPRSIWVHPLDDGQYRKEHNLPPLSPHPPSSPKGEKSKIGDEKASAAGPSNAAAGPSKQQPKGKDHERGFFGKMKDGMIGTKEEREERKRLKAEEDRRREQEFLERRRILMEQARLQDQQRQQYYAMNGPLGRAGYQYGSAYAPPPGTYARRGGGGMGMGLPLMGGLAGGLLLGEALDGGFGGGFDGGGFDGGFGGGGFGGF